MANVDDVTVSNNVLVTAGMKYHADTKATAVLHVTNVDDAAGPTDVLVAASKKAKNADTTTSTLKVFDAYLEFHISFNRVTNVDDVAVLILPNAVHVPVSVVDFVH